MLEDKLMADFKEAMKNGDALKRSVISFLRSQLKNIAIEKKKDKLEDVDVIAVIKKQIKQRAESVEKFKIGKRLDLVEKEEKEMEILKKYCPEEMPREELDKIVEETIASVGANSLKDMGKVMKEIMPKVSGRADNKILSESIRAKLTKDEGGNPEGE
jgi:uncharacterized protein YqeY